MKRLAVHAAAAVRAGSTSSGPGWKRDSGPPVSAMRAVSRVKWESVAHREASTAVSAAVVGPSDRASACRSARTRLSCSARMRFQEGAGSLLNSTSWCSRPKSRAQRRNRPVTTSSSPASARRAALNSRSVSSMWKRAPEGLSSTLIRD